MSLERGPGRPPHDDLLTPAEWRVAEAVRHGLSNPPIAARLAVSVDAVKFHVGNALQKLGFSGRAELRRWDGVRRDSLLQERTTVMASDLKLGPFGQISRIVTDINAATRWYADVLGLPHLYSFGDLAFFDCGSVRLFLSQGEASSESILYFRVADVHTAAAALTARGVGFVNAPHMIHRHEDGTEEWMAFFHDPDGRPLAICLSRVPLEAPDPRYAVLLLAIGGSAAKAVAASAPPTTLSGVKLLQLTPPSRDLSRSLLPIATCSVCVCCSRSRAQPSSTSRAFGSGSRPRLPPRPRRQAVFRRSDSLQGASPSDARSEVHRTG